MVKSFYGYAIALIMLIWCLSAIGVNLSTIFASIGIVALVICFAAESLIEDVVTGPTRAIAFGCTCSLERFLAAYARLPRETLEGMLRPLRPREERCHLCGRRYTITPEHLVKLLQDKTETK